MRGVTAIFRMDGRIYTINGRSGCKSMFAILHGGITRSMDATKTNNEAVSDG